jgi:hypothetical protein
VDARVGNLAGLQFADLTPADVLAFPQRWLRREEAATWVTFSQVKQMYEELDSPAVSALGMRSR